MKFLGAAFAVGVGLGLATRSDAAGCCPAAKGILVDYTPEDTFDMRSMSHAPSSAHRVARAPGVIPGVAHVAGVARVAKSAAKPPVTRIDVEQIIADAIADSIDPLRQLADQDGGCTSNRSSLGFWTDDTNWEVQSTDMGETIFSRFVYDMGMDDDYWKVGHEEVLAQSYRIAALNVGPQPFFLDAWEDDEAADPGVSCALGYEDAFSAADVTLALAKERTGVVFLAPTQAEVNYWQKFKNDYFKDFVGGAALSTTDPVTDMYNALQASTGAYNPFGDCYVCIVDDTTTTSTTTSTEKPGDPGATPPLSTTTSGSGSTTEPEEKATTPSGAVGKVVYPSLFVGALATLLM